MAELITDGHSELSLAQCERVGGEIGETAKIIQAISEFRYGNGSEQQLNQAEEKLFGNQRSLWDEKSGISKSVNNTIIKAEDDSEITRMQVADIRTGIETYCRNLQRGDHRLVDEQREEVLRLTRRGVAGGERRVNEILAAAIELIDSKDRFRQDRELMGRLEKLGDDKSPQPIEKNLDKVREATDETKKRDQKGKRSYVEGNTTITREKWFTQVWESTTGQQFNRETASQIFIEEEIETSGGVNTQAQQFANSHKFGTGSEEMVAWRFFKRRAFDRVIQQHSEPQFIKTSIDQIKEVARRIDDSWNEARGLPTEQLMKELTVGGALVREVWRVLQDNVRAGLTLRENDVTDDMLASRPNPSLNPKIVRSKAEGIFEVATNPRQRAEDLNKFTGLYRQHLRLLGKTEAEVEDLMVKGRMTSGEGIIVADEGQKVNAKIDSRSEMFNPMFLVDKSGAVRFEQLEYQVWQARAKLHLLTNTAMPVHEPLHDEGVTGPSAWVRIEQMSSFPNKALSEEMLHAEFSPFIPGTTEFWLMQFYLNQGKDLVAENPAEIPYYKKTLVDRFNEVVVKAYFAPAIDKRGEQGVWPRHGNPVSREIYSRRLRQLEQGQMIWPESNRPMMVDLLTYAQWQHWKAISHTTEFGMHEFQEWIRGKGYDPENPGHFIQLFPQFFSEKMTVGLATHVSSDLIWNTMGMVTEYYPMVPNEKGQMVELTSLEQIYKYRAKHPDQAYIGQLYEYYFGDMEQTRREYIQNNIGAIEQQIYEYVAQFLQGNESAPALAARRWLAPQFFQLWTKYAFARHEQDNWCGTTDHPNKYYLQRVVKVGSLKVGATIQAPQDIDWQARPIDYDLVSGFDANAARMTPQQLAAMILSAVPDEVIDKHALTVLLANKKHVFMQNQYRAVQALKAQLEKTAKRPVKWHKVFESIATGASVNELASVFAEDELGRQDLAPLVETLFSEISFALRRRAGPILSPATFYEAILFAWAREEVDFYKEDKRGLPRFLKLDEAFLANVDTWEQVARWEFKTGAREGEPIFYHPLYSPGGEEFLERYLSGQISASGLTNYDPESQEKWKGDYILSMAADTFISVKVGVPGVSVHSQQGQYAELLRYAPLIPIDLNHKENPWGQLQAKLDAESIYRPSNDYIVAPKFNEVEGVILTMESTPPVKAAMVERYYGPRGFWGIPRWIRKNWQYHAIDISVGRPDFIEKILEGFKKSTSTFAAGPAGSILDFFFNNPISPFPQFRGSLISIPAGIIVGAVIAGTPIGLATGIIAGLYTHNLGGWLIQKIFGQWMESSLNDNKNEGIVFRRLPTTADFELENGKPKKSRLASARVDPSAKWKKIWCTERTIHHELGKREHHPLDMRERENQIYAAFMKGQLGS